MIWGKVHTTLFVAALSCLGTQAFSQETGDPGGPKVFRFLMQWSPQSQFAGYYLAADRSLFEKSGVQVEIIEGGPERDPAAWLRAGKADFATLFLTGALAARAEGVPVVHLAQVVNRSTQMLVAWKKHGIEELADLDERRVSVWGGGFRPGYLAVFESAGVRPEIVPQYYSVNLFLHEGVVACAAMEYNEYHMLYQAGIDHGALAAWYMRDIGFDIPEDGIYCLEETYRRYPAACQAIAEASLAGWRLAGEDPEAALDTVMHHVLVPNVPTNRPHMRWMLEKILPAILPGEEGSWTFGVLDPKDYARAAETLKRYGVVDTAPSYAAFRGEAADGP